MSTPATKEDQVVLLLRSTLVRCSSILALISSSSTNTTTSSAIPNPSAEEVPIKDIRNDHVTLSTQLGKSCTNLSLAFKPPVSRGAVEGTLKVVAESIGKVEYYLGALIEGKAGASALALEIKATAEDVVESVRLLLEASSHAYEASSSSTLTTSKSLREVVLRQTGQVWAAVERAQNVAPSELEALRRRWKGVLGIVDDCLEEVKAMLESPVGGEDEEEEEEEASEDEDDFRSSRPLSELERSRVKAAHFLLRLARLLLNRLIGSTVEGDGLSKGYKDEAFGNRVDRLIKQLSASADDVAGSLDPPQSLDELDETVSKCIKDVEELGKVMKGAVGEGLEESQDSRGDEKWLPMWDTQWQGAKKKMRQSMDPDQLTAV